MKRRQAEKKLLETAAKKYSSNKEDFEDLIAPGKGKNKQQQQQQRKQPQKVNKRREWKNAKFGHGGQKKRSKWNTADSVDDPKSTFKKGGAFARVNRNKPGASAKMKKQRPGKIARAQQRGQRAGGKKR